MIVLKNLTKTFKRGPVESVIFKDVNLEFDVSQRLAVLGPRGSGKTTFLHLLAGLERPTRGKIERFRDISLPIGYPRSYRPMLTCRENATFLARCYGADVAEVIRFVEEMIELGPEFDIPLRELRPEARLQFCYLLSYAMPFDTYLIDNAPAAGTHEFREKCLAMLAERMKTAGIIYAMWDTRFAKRFCESALLIANQTLVYYPDIDEALWNLNNLNREVV
jgi:capsular polysaccharide transport system ATP-binding protein